LLGVSGSSSSCLVLNVGVVKKQENKKERKEGRKEMVVSSEGNK
jgi:hypothetical protein